MSIGPLIPAASNLSVIEKAIQKGANSNFVQNLVTKQAADKNFYPNFVLGLIVLQNLINTVVYTYASWNNTGMPKEQRKFAAAIDMMNGIFNFGIILSLGRIINNNSEKWAETIAKPFKDAGQLANFELAKKGFRSFLTIIVAGVFVQRVIVPFFSTPCAKWFKEKYLVKDKSKDISYTGNQPPNAKKLNSSNPLPNQKLDATNPFKPFETFMNTK